MKYQRSTKSAQTAFYSFPSTYLCNQLKAVEFSHNRLNIQKLNYCIQRVKNLASQLETNFITTSILENIWESYV
jgi:hypothetical protein